MTRLRTAVIGVGHLGKEHARILASLPEVELVGVADLNPEQAEAIARNCRTRAFTDHRALLGKVEAVVVAVPTAFHHAVARDFLERGTAALVEKPLTADLSQAEELAALASRRQALLQVGHIERFNPAFEALCQTPLRPRYISCERYGPFSGRSTDVGVVLDLMIHDLDLVRALDPAPVCRVEALGAAVLGGHEDLAQARVTFADGCVADFRASRVHPEGVRRMHLWGAEGFACLDLARRHVTLAQPGERLRSGRIDSRRLDPATLAGLKARLFEDYIDVRSWDGGHADQLTRELQAFVRCVRTGASPRVDGQAGRDALALAHQVLEALRAHRWEGAEGPAGPLFGVLPPSEAA
jgi:predicted dehydrogenase